MFFISHIFSEPIIHALGWTLFHSLWQGLLLAVLLAISMPFIPKRNASKRYLVYGAAFVALFVVSVTTFISLYASQSKEVHSIIHAPRTQIIFMPSDASETSSSLLTTTQQLFSYLNDHINIITSLWLCGVLLFLIHLISSFFYTQQLRYKHNWQLSVLWEERMNTIAQQLRVQHSVTLLASNLTEVPLVIGHLKPMILLPIGAINNLSVAEVEAILAHELAHIARNDYFFNILQACLDVLFFYHPIAWWISTNIRIERENCCDDLAMTVCNNTLAYAKALTNLTISTSKSSGFALGMLGVKNQLLNRIKRILNQPYNHSTNMEKFVVTCLLLMALCFLSIQQNKATNVVGTDTTWMLADTIPNLTPGKIKIKVNKNGQRIESELENGVIQSLTIDGKAISKEEFKDYEPMLEDIMAEVPPPTPVPVPPVSPVPPVPASPTLKNNTTIRIDKQTDGNTFLYIKGDKNITIELDEINESNTIDSKTLKTSEKFLLKTIDYQLGAIDSLKLDLPNMKLILEQERLALDSTLQALEKMQKLQASNKIQVLKDAEIMKEHSAMMEQHLYIIKKHNEMIEEMKKNNKVYEVFSNKMLEELKKDGLIKENNLSYKIELSNDKMTINKKNQPDSIHKKYLDFYKIYFNKDLKKSYYWKLHNSILQL